MSQLYGIINIGCFVAVTMINDLKLATWQYWSTMACLMILVISTANMAKHLIND